MHAFLIVGKSQIERQNEVTKRIEAWQISPWDTTRLAAGLPTIGIGDIRDFQRALMLTPQNSPAKVGVLSDIHRLTVEAQNALLKTLEEPPPNTYILAETATPDILLPTILSRFSLVNTGQSDTLDEKTIDQYKTLLTELLVATPGAKLQRIEAYTATRDDAKLFVDQAIHAARHMLLAGGSDREKIAKLIHNLFAAQAQLAVNVNPKLVIDIAIL